MDERKFFMVGDSLGNVAGEWAGRNDFIRITITISRTISRRKEATFTACPRIPQIFANHSEMRVLKWLEGGQVSV
jgi:hypothetical protein